MDLLEAGACVLWLWPLGVKESSLEGEGPRGLRRFDEQRAVFIRQWGDFRRLPDFLKITLKSPLSGIFRTENTPHLLSMFHKLPFELVAVLFL